MNVSPFFLLGARICSFAFLFVCIFFRALLDLCPSPPHPTPLHPTPPHLGLPAHTQTCFPPSKLFYVHFTDNLLWFTDNLLWLSPLTRLKCRYYVKGHFLWCTSLENYDVWTCQTHCWWRLHSSTWCQRDFVTVLPTCYSTVQHD
jgi:hypothetical protein